MPLDKAGLKINIETLLTDLYNNTANITTAAAREKFATDLSDAIYVFVRTGLVTVTTTGTAAAHTGTGNIQ